MRLRSPEEPKPPEDVRVQLIDGSEIPIELTYNGLDHRGMHVWIQVSPETIRRSQFRSASVGMLPGRTSISIIFEEDLNG